MRIRVISAERFDDLREEYLNILKKYNLEKEKYGFENFWFETQIRYKYYITINTLEELFNLIKDLQQDLIIRGEDNSITIYDSYVE